MQRVHQVSGWVLPERAGALLHPCAGEPLVRAGDVAALVSAIPGDGALLLGRMGGDGSVAVPSRKSPKACAESPKPPDVMPARPPQEEDDAFPDVTDRLRRIMEDASSPLTASRAIHLIAQFMTLAPYCSKEDMDRLKMLDKFLNTARALMETQLKTEDAQSLHERLDAIERDLAS